MRILPLAVGVVSAFWSFLPLVAQENDGPPIDAKQILSMLQEIRNAKEQQIKSLRSEALQKASMAAASPQAAAVAWEEAVRAVQFDGASREGAQFRDWKDKEGAGLKEKEGQNAARLYFQWLSLTLQRANGTSVQQMMPALIQYTKDLMANEAAMLVFEERLADAKRVAAESAAGRRVSSAAERAKDFENAKRMHDSILKHGLASAPPVLAFKAGELIKVPNWEDNPGNVDGIYTKIILPEFRRTADAKLLDYWDMKLRREAEKASSQALAFETEKFNQVRRPELLWARAKDEFLLGKRNRAVANMFSLVKNYPTHPKVEGWIGELERNLSQLIAPAAQ